MRRIVRVVLAVALASAIGVSPAMATTVNESGDASASWWYAQGPLGVGNHSGTLSTDGDVDWYYFYVNSTAATQVGFTPPDPWEATVYRYTDGSLDEVESLYGTDSLNRELSAGLYYISVDDNGWDPTGAYTIGISGDTVGTSPASGVPAAPGVASYDETIERWWTDATGPFAVDVANVASLGTDGDVDWYYFYVNATAATQVGFTPPDPWEAEVYRYTDGALESIESLYGWDSLNQELTAGLYYISVDDNGWDPTGTYGLVVRGATVTSSPSAALPRHPIVQAHDETTEEDFTDAAGPLARSVAHEGYIAADEDTDWYYFRTAATYPVRVGFTAPNSWRATVYRYTDGALDEVESLWGWSDSFNQELPEGTYYVEIDQSGWSADTERPYTLVVQGQSVATRRVAGIDRYATAVEASKANFGGGASTVVLATGADYPDALAASGLAGAYGAPLLLTTPGALPTTVRDEIKRLKATKIIIVGGTGAVSSAVQQQVDSLPNVGVERIAGANRYATAAAIAARVKAQAGSSFSNTAFVVTGTSFADALAVSPAAYNRKIPILLTQPTVATQATVDAIKSLGITNIVIAGGTGAVSDAVKNKLGATAVRVSGADRYATSAEVAAYCTSKGWVNFKFVGIATGSSFPDALGGGVSTGRNAGVLLLVQPTALPAAAKAKIVAYKSSVRWMQIYGGTGAVNEEVVQTICDQLPLY